MLALPWRLLSWIESEQNYTMRFGLTAHTSQSPWRDAGSKFGNLRIIRASYRARNTIQLPKRG